MAGIDFYFRNQNDPNFKDGILQVTDEIENTVQQVRMTLLTKKGEVLGEPDFGFDSDKYVFEFDNFSTKVIDQDANEQVRDYVMMAKKYQLEVQSGYLDGIDDEFRPGLVLNVKINGNQTAFSAMFDV